MSRCCGSKDRWDCPFNIVQTRKLAGASSCPQELVIAVAGWKKGRHGCLSMECAPFWQRPAKLATGSGDARRCSTTVHHSRSFLYNSTFHFPDEYIPGPQVINFMCLAPRRQFLPYLPCSSLREITTEVSNGGPCQVAFCGEKTHRILCLSYQHKHHPTPDSAAVGRL